MKENKFEEYRGKPPLGHIKEWSDGIVEATNTTLAWALAITFTMLATFVPNAYVLVDGDRLLLNIWVLNIAPPAQYSKSRPLRAFPEKIIPYIEERLGIIIRFPSSFTPEAITHFLHPKVDEDGEEVVQVKHEGFVQLKDEYSSIFNEGKKDYKADIFEHLTMTYDGWIPPSWTVQHGIERGVPIYLNVLAATTPDFLTQMNRGGRSTQFFKQGLASRFLYINRGQKPPHRDYMFNEEGRRVELVSEIANSLIRLDMYDVKRIEVGPEARDLFNEFSRYIDDLVDDYNQQESYSVHAAFLDRQKIKATKLAALHCINRNLDSIIKAVDDARGETTPVDVPLEINMYDAEWAIGLMEEYWIYFQEIIDEWRADSVSSEIVTINRHKEVVRAAIKRSEHGIVFEKVIGTALGGRIDTIEKVVDTMIMCEELYKFPKEFVSKIPPEIRRQYGILRAGQPTDLYSLEPFPFSEYLP